MALTVFCKHESDGICAQPVTCGGKLFCEKEPIELKAAWAEARAEAIRKSGFELSFWRDVFQYFAASSSFTKEKP